MTDTSPEARAVRRRWINLGEFVAVAGLIISGLALWNSWGGDKEREPDPVAERTRAIPIALRGTVSDDGKTLTLSPIETGHSLDRATLTANGKSVDIGSDGEVSASDLQRLVDKPGDNSAENLLPVTMSIHYVEAGEDKSSKGSYRIRFRWTNGGIFDGRDLRITGFSRG
ncbi:hypothetical protein H9L12_05500 [Sphingomonas rhizophila]|uniref:Uncharacterized protein n=1 Tax=Sphingomonas rhizophila TaxID=2071607 RepID=A0A7G9SDP0_9SPHN|nr:hypothetical protein [Sphingomonas rhizophila]QNN65965.1 hypothetical protein H9L12_05500 [Sphingomonas rhizophila]